MNENIINEEILEKLILLSNRQITDFIRQHGMQSKSIIHSTKHNVSKTKRLLKYKEKLSFYSDTIIVEEYNSITRSIKYSCKLCNNSWFDSPAPDEELVNIKCPKCKKKKSTKGDN